MKKNLAALLLILFCFVTPAEAALLQPTTIPQNIGVNIHVVDKDLDDQVALLKEAGFGWVRKDLFWGNIEKEKGVYDFSKYEELVDAFNKVDIKVLFILDYRNLLYDNYLSPYTHEGRQAFVNFAQAAAKHFSKRNVAWEIYNEPNWTFWKPMPHVQNYIKLARVVTQTLRRTVPHQAIIAPALAGPTDEPHKIEGQFIYLKMVLEDKIAKQWDGISVHPYRGNRPPEDVFNDVPRLKKLLSQHGIKAPLIFGEWGYHTSDKGISEYTEAAYVVRSFLISNSLRMPFSIWYNWQEQGDDNSESEHKYGLIRYGSVDKDDEAIKKPAFEAIKEFNTLMSGYRFDKVISNHDGKFCFRFTNGKKIAYVAWTSGKEPAPYQLALTVGKWQSKQILGDSGEITAENGNPASLQLGPMPLIVWPVLK